MGGGLWQWPWKSSSRGQLGCAELEVPGSLSQREAAGVHLGCGRVWATLAWRDHSCPVSRCAAAGGMHRDRSFRNAQMSASMEGDELI